MRFSPDGSFREGLRVTILLPGGREKAALARWSNDNIAHVYLLERFSAAEPDPVKVLSGPRL